MRTPRSSRLRRGECDGRGCREHHGSVRDYPNDPLDAAAVEPVHGKRCAGYLDLVANPEATIEIGSETKKVKARVAEQPERDELYNRNAAMFPQFAEYETKTTRQIPVIVLTPTD